MTCKSSAKTLMNLFFGSRYSSNYNQVQSLYLSLYISSLDIDPASVTPPLIYFFNLEIIVVNVHVIVLILDDLRFVIGHDD